MTKLNWGIIGLGSIAQKFSEAFAETSNSKLLAVASNNSEKLESFKNADINDAVLLTVLRAQQIVKEINDGSDH